MPDANSSLHEKVDCSGVWGSRHTCEVPCADEIHPNAQGQSPGSSCSGSLVNPGGTAITWECYEGAQTSVFEYMGVRGCCAKRSTPNPPNSFSVYFIECD